MNNVSEEVKTALTCVEVYFVKLVDGDPKIWTRDIDVITEALIRGDDVRYIHKQDQKNTESVDGEIGARLFTMNGSERPIESFIKRSLVPHTILKSIKEAKIEPEGDFGGIAGTIPEVQLLSSFQLLNLSFTEAGDVDRFLEKYPNNVLHNDSIGWLHWNSKRWIVGQKYVFKKVREMLESMLEDEAMAIAGAFKYDEQIVKLYSTHVKTFSNNNKINSIMGFLSNYVDIEPKKLDKQVGLLNLENGILDMDTGELLEHDPKYKITKIARAEYDPEASSKFHEELFNKWFPDAELRAYVIRALGMTIAGVTDEQVFFFGYDARGKNGKTTLSAVILQLLNDYGLRTSINAFQSDPKATGSSLTPWLVDFRGARMVVTNETSDATQLDAPLLKGITGGEGININPKNRPAYHVEAKCNIWIFGNKEPKVDDTTDALWRRVQLIPFENRITDDELIPMPEILRLSREESSGLVNLLLAGYRDYKEQGLNPPKKIVQATEAYRLSQDDLTRFIYQECKVSPKNIVDKRTLYDGFMSFRRAEGIFGEYSMVKLTKNLKSLNIKVDSNRRSYEGVYYEAAKDIGFTAEDEVTKVAESAVDELYEGVK